MALTQTQWTVPVDPNDPATEGVLLEMLGDSLAQIDFYTAQVTLTFSLNGLAAYASGRSLGEACVSALEMLRQWGVEE